MWWKLNPYKGYTPKLASEITSVQMLFVTISLLKCMKAPSHQKTQLSPYYLALSPFTFTHENA